MACIRYEQLLVECRDGETVLDALLRHGVPVSHSCKAAVCGSCLMRSAGGPIPPPAQAGLKDSWKARGYFLACAHKPEADITVAQVEGDLKCAATIAALGLLSADVLRVDLRCETPFAYRPGQYITLIRGDGLSRSYSIASLPAEGKLELHVRRTPNGRMSGWLFDQARVGDRVSLLGPSGECFYVAGRADQPLLLVGTGTGLAPLYGVLRDAIQHGHRGPIHLFHGAVRPEGLYLQVELARLASENANVAYTPSVLATDGPLDQAVLARFPRLREGRAFVCGDPAIVQSFRKKLFLNGVALRDIHADAFVPSQT
jgi:NAD(P)H-flavin reductase/ferredoxin